MQYVVASVKYAMKRQKNTVPKRLTEAFDKVKYPTKVIKTSVCGKNNVGTSPRYIRFAVCGYTRGVCRGFIAKGIVLGQGLVLINL